MGRLMRVPRSGTAPMRDVEYHRETVDGRGGVVYVLTLSCGHETKRRQLESKTRCGRCVSTKKGVKK